MGSHPFIRSAMRRIKNIYVYISDYLSVANRNTLYALIFGYVTISFRCYAKILLTHTFMAIAIISIYLYLSK